MANFVSSLYASSLNPKVRINYAELQSIRVVEIPFTIPVGAVANDTVQLFPIKKGETVLPSSRVYFPALGASTAIRIGDATTDARYLASTSTAAAGNALIEAGAIARTKESALTPLTLKFTGANPTAGEVIKVVLHLGQTR